MSQNQFIVVKTEYGPVKGIKKDSIFGIEYKNFQKIPYMKPPTGNLRFRDPQPPEKWIEPIDATENPPAFCGHDFVTKRMIGQLDAMYINVYTKYIEPKTIMPVMVFIHGGGFQSGSSRTDLYGPDYLLLKDVVLVTFNYRMGVFGFLSLEDKTLNIPGNVGLRDQTFALKWVKNNIQNFGGDSNNITLFGESAGGASVHYHLISEYSKGLFHRAIAMSGVAFNKTWTVAPKRNWAERLATAAGWDGNGGEKAILEFLEEADPSKLVDLSNDILTEEEKLELSILFPFGPTIEPYVADNCFIPKDPVLMAREAWGNDIDVLFGACSNEGLLTYFNAKAHDWDINKFVEKFSQVLPIELGIGFNDEKAKHYGKILMNLYYKSEKPTSENIQGYYNYVADTMFWHGIQRAIFSRTDKKGKSYLYRFDANLSINLLKKLEPAIAKYDGACHGDDLGYIFKTILGCPFTVESKEFEIIKRMVNTFAKFATNGEVDWNPITSTELPLKAMNIRGASTHIEVPENKRLAVWNEIYKTENCLLY